MIENILITGATQGLGRALAYHFSTSGYFVYAVGRNRDELCALANNNPRIHPIIANITCAEDRQLIYRAVKGKPFSIIHNAGIAEPSSFANLAENTFRSHLETNVIAPLLLTQQLLPLLIPDQRVLHITSGAATMPLPGLIHYCVTKAAMQHAVLCLNEELKHLAIYCGNVRPGLMDTSMTANWEKVGESDLPNKDFYIHARETAQLISPEIAATFIAWIMLATSNEAFSQTAWNIYDKSHQAHWLPKGLSMPQPPLR